jgi:hypothetical protein
MENKLEEISSINTCINKIRSIFSLWIEYKKSNMNCDQEILKELKRVIEILITLNNSYYILFIYKHLLTWDNNSYNKATEFKN